MNAIEQAAVSYLTKRGYRVFALPVEPSPDSVWCPTRGASHERCVRDINGGWIVYREGSGWGGCKTTSWRRWVQRARAVQVVA